MSNYPPDPGEIAAVRVEERLCGVCRTLDFRDFASKPNGGLRNLWVTMPMMAHHLTDERLIRAIENGCSLCRYLRDGLLQNVGLSRYEGGLDGLNQKSDLSPGYKILLWRNPTYNINPDVIGFKYGRCTQGDLFEMVEPKATFEFKITDESPALADKPFALRIAKSEPDFRLASNWLSKCTQNHPLCNSAPRSSTPSRILDIGDDRAGLHPRLVEYPDLDTAYTTLSHCWGTSHPLRTTTSNYNSHLNGIPLESFPRTFRDAIDVTRKMGFQYIWIDSLCIIQDLPSDWERESSLMAGIYGNSTLTITGPAAGHSEAGFLAREPSKTPFSVDVPYKGPDTMSKDTTITIHLADEKDYSEWDCEPKNVLATRGWVLQERMLSRRTLYFGSRIMYWECMTGYRREDFHYQINPRLIYGSAVPKISLDKADDISVRGHWNDIVRTYSNCLLTYKTDKFPALSGIAHAMSEKLHDDYLAGLWKRGIHDGLSWYISKASSDFRVPTVDSPFIAPSWSWASVPQNVHFNYHSVGPAVQEQLDILQADIDSIEATIEPQASDKFGVIRVAKLRMRFAIKKAFLKKSVESRYSHGAHLDVCDHYSRRPVAVFLPDYHQYIQSFDRGKEHEVLCLLLGYTHREGEFKFNALAVEPVSAEKLQYRRVGMVQYFSGLSPGDWTRVSAPPDWIKIGNSHISSPHSWGIIAHGDWFETFERLFLELV